MEDLPLCNGRVAESNLTETSRWVTIKCRDKIGSCPELIYTVFKKVQTCPTNTRSPVLMRHHIFRLFRDLAQYKHMLGKNFSGRLLRSLLGNFDKWFILRGSWHRRASSEPISHYHYFVRYISYYDKCYLNKYVSNRKAWSGPDGWTI